MGGTESHHGHNKVVDEAKKSFHAVDFEMLEECYAAICNISSAPASDSPKKQHKTKHGFGEGQFKEYTKNILPERFQTRIFSEMVNIGNSLNRAHSHSHSHAGEHVSIDTFHVIMSRLLKSTADDRIHIFMALCGSENSVSRDQIRETLDDLLNSYFLAEGQTLEFATWHLNMASLKEEKTAFVDYLMNDLHFDEQDRVLTDKLEKWMSNNPVIISVMDSVFFAAFHLNKGKEKEDSTFSVTTIPTCEMADDSKNETPLGLCSLLLLNQQIPNELRQHWRLLYSTATHGDSFSTLLKCITNQGPTIILIKDENEYVFGGFASKSWVLGPNFFGDESCYLFTIRPEMRVYTPTGYNQNYCYLNTHQQTLPNGLGFGGQLQVGEQVSFFSLWLDAEFGIGKTQGGCTTYHSPRLSANENFKIAHLEVWAVGGNRLQSINSKDKPNASILDKADYAAKAILEMTGKTQHSEGLREPHKDD